MELLAGRYEITGRLGSGGMSVVHQGYDQRLDRRVAIKVMNRGYGERPVDVARFKREAQVMARLEHPGVPTVYDAGLLPDGRVYLVMQLVRGRTLSDVLRSGPLSLHQAVAFAAQVSEVLAYAHELNVVHRDLKPGNVMLTKSGAVKVLDFGIAAALVPDPDRPGLTAAGAMSPGTPGYVSPEQVKGQPATQRSDLYALGWVLYELVAGKKPLDGPPLVLLGLRLTETPAPMRPSRPDVPEKLDALVTRLLAVDPDSRPASANEVRALIEPWIAEFAPHDVAPEPTAYDPVTPYARLLGAAEPAAPARPASPPERQRGVPAQSGGGGRALLPDRRVDRARELTAEGRHSQAAELLTEAVASLTAVAEAGAVPVLAPESVEVRLELCASLRASGDLPRACDAYARLGRELAEARSALDADVLTCRRGEALCLRDMGRTAEALHVFEELLPAQRQAFGPGDSQVLDTRYRIAALMAGTAGRLGEARAELEDLKRDQRVLLADSDPWHQRVARLAERLDRVARTMSGHREAE